MYNNDFGIGCDHDTLLAVTVKKTVACSFWFFSITLSLLQLMGLPAHEAVFNFFEDKIKSSKLVSQSQSLVFKVIKSSHFGSILQSLGTILNIFNL